MADSLATNIADALEDLKKEDFEKFVFQLLHSKQKPKVLQREVEDKSYLEITDILVSKFTAKRALRVTVTILKHISCNQVAQELVSKTKAFLDRDEPLLRKTPNGNLDLNPSQEAQKCAADNWHLRAAPAGRRPQMKTPKVVEDEAKARVRSEDGDTGNSRLVLSQFAIQFGKYKDKTFKWLLENDLTYTARLVAEHQRERQDDKSQNSHMANKDSLTSYAIAYTDVLEEVRFHRRNIEAKEKSMRPRQAGEALVGFGVHRNMTLKDLYESTMYGKISYVQFLRDKKSTCEKGSLMEDAIKYILKRDQSRKRLRKKKQTESTRKTRT